MFQRGFNSVPRRFRSFPRVLKGFMGVRLAGELQQVSGELQQRPNLWFQGSAEAFKAIHSISACLRRVPGVTEMLPGILDSSIDFQTSFRGFHRCSKVFQGV